MNMTVSEAVAWRWRTTTNGTNSPWKTTPDRSLVEVLMREPSVYEVEPLYLGPSRSEVDEAMVQRARDAYWDRLSEVIGGVSDGDDLDAIRAAIIAALEGK